MIQYRQNIFIKKVCVPNCLQNQILLLDKLKIDNMRSLKILAILLFAGGLANAQDLNSADVPANLKNTFCKEYPKATDVEWEKELDHYKVEFEINRHDHEIWYNAAGSTIKKEQEIKEAELPQTIRAVIKSKYAGYRVYDAEIVWKNKVKTYEVELEKGLDEKHVIFDDKAKVLTERDH